MSPLEPAARYAPSLITAPFIPLIQGEPFDLWWLLFVPLGLILGWMARAGRMIADNYSYREIKKDILVSILIGGANGVLASTIIWWLKLPYLPGTGVSFACAFGGVSSLNAAWVWLRKQLTADLAGEERQELQRQQSAIAVAHKLELDMLAKKIDRLTEGHIHDV